MKLTLINVEQIYNTLLEMKNKTLPIETSLAIALNINEMSNTVKVILDHKLELCNEYGKKDEKNNLIQENGIVSLKEETLAEFNEKLTKMYMTEVELNLQTITLDDIKGCFQNEKPEKLLSLLKIVKQ